MFQPIQFTIKDKMATYRFYKRLFTDSKAFAVIVKVCRFVVLFSVLCHYLVFNFEVFFMLSYFHTVVVRALNGQNNKFTYHIEGHYDKSLKICRITNVAEIIISRYGAKSNSILVDIMEYDMRSKRTSIVKKWEIE